jgi:two-component system, cell cycle sensor histidine kinase and response regulator CckA
MCAHINRTHAGNSAKFRALERRDYCKDGIQAEVTLVIDKAGSQLVQPAPAEPRTEGRETILLVEDEPAVRQLFAIALGRAGYHVHQARNGQEAVQVFDEHGPSIDLLLTDVRMPYMGGVELAQQLRARSSHLKLICISGYPGTLDVDVAGDYLAKPFSRDDLLKKVREVLDRQ